MSRLVIVSNRVPDPRGGAKAGGLAAALQPALTECGGLWFGWSGTVCDHPDPEPAVMVNRAFALATLDLSAHEFAGYYETFANRTLWPALHGRLDLVVFDHQSYGVYRDVNARFARTVHGLLGAGDAIWIHDYHLIPLARELRRLGVTRPIGFFLHTPFPAAETVATLPWARELAEDLAACDLIGFQTPACAQNFHDLISRHVGGTVDAAGRISLNGWTAETDAFPIGIDTAAFKRLTATPAVAARLRRLRQCLNGQIGVVGVERLDYSKGLVQRFRAFEALLDQAPHYRGRVSLLQVAAPSRSSIPEYRTTATEIETLSGHINARFSKLDWVPVRYLNRPFTHAQVAALYRACRVGLVTPLRDGMNLVAKEYVTAQDPDDPGVLILSRFAGAAHELHEALLVNPYDTAAVVEALRTALEMPREARKAQWQSLMSRIEVNDVHRWRRRFLDALATASAHHGVRVAA